MYWYKLLITQKLNNQETVLVYSTSYLIIPADFFIWPAILIFDLVFGPIFRVDLNSNHGWNDDHSPSICSRGSLEYIYGAINSRTQHFSLKSCAQHDMSTKHDRYIAESCDKKLECTCFWTKDISVRFISDEYSQYHFCFLNVMS